MPKDTDEELQRLQQALLEAEEDETATQEEDDELPEIVPEEDPYIPNAGVYQNFSNNYGRSLRNYASGYRAYNSDRVDTLMEPYSEEVREGGKSLRLLWIIVILLALLNIVVVAVLWKLFRGIF